MNTLLDYIAINRELWNKKTPYHVASKFYDNDAFLAGRNTLKAPELELLGDVKGLHILHLQCHFGQDTLSLARMGAKVTGLDLSDEAIAQARKMAAELELDATFVCANVYEIPTELHGQFDLVFTSYGTIVWLPDMNRWANSIAQCLKPGGRFVFTDTHPVAMTYDDNFKGMLYSYFNRGHIDEVEQGTYADRSADIELPSVTWNHSMAEVLQALISAGLSLSQIKEYDYIPYECFGNMVKTGNDRYQVKGMEGMAPLTFGLEAIKK